MELLLIIIAVTVLTGLSWVALDLVEVAERRRRARPARLPLRHGKEVRS